MLRTKVKALTNAALSTSCRTDLLSGSYCRRPPWCGCFHQEDAKAQWQVCKAATCRKASAQWTGDNAGTWLTLHEIACGARKYTKPIITAIRSHLPTHKSCNKLMQWEWLSCQWIDSSSKSLHRSVLTCTCIELGFCCCSGQAWYQQAPGPWHMWQQGYQMPVPAFHAYGPMFPQGPPIRPPPPRTPPGPPPRKPSTTKAPPAPQGQPSSKAPCREQESKVEAPVKILQRPPTVSKPQAQATSSSASSHSEPVRPHVTNLCFRRRPHDTCMHAHLQLHIHDACLAYLP